MKKSSIILFLSLLLCGCRQEIISSIDSSGESTSSLISEVSSIFDSEPSSSSSSEKVSSSISEDISSIVSSSSESSSSEETKQTLSIGEVLSLGQTLSEGEESEVIKFECLYVKALTDNFDKLMLFVDNDNYVFVRVEGGFDDYLKNRYL